LKAKLPKGYKVDAELDEPVQKINIVCTGENPDEKVKEEAEKSIKAFREEFSKIFKQDGGKDKEKKNVKIKVIKTEKKEKEEQ